MKTTLLTLFFLPFFLVAFSVQANSPVFTYSSTGTIPSTSFMGRTYIKTYKITAHIATKAPLFVRLEPNSNEFSLQNNCVKPLAKNEACSVSVVLKPISQGKKNAKLVINSAPFAILDTTLSSMTSKLYLGHLAFVGKDGKPINSLTLHANDKGAFKVSNTGQAPISAFMVQVPSTLTKYFTSGSCLNTHSLAVKEACDVNYVIPSQSTKIKDAIIVKGKGADNSPAKLPVSISNSPGHLEFQTESGNKIQALDIIKGKAPSGVLLSNTGDSSLFNLQVNIPEALKPLVTTTCGKFSELKPGTHCLLMFSPYKEKSLQANIVARATSVDNSPIKLVVKYDRPSSVYFYCQAGFICGFEVEYIDSAGKTKTKSTDYFPIGQHKTISLPGLTKPYKVTPFYESSDGKLIHMKGYDSSHFTQEGDYKGKMWGTVFSPQSCLTLNGKGCV